MSWLLLTLIKGHLLARSLYSVENACELSCQVLHMLVIFTILHHDSYKLGVGRVAQSV